MEINGSTIITLGVHDGRFHADDVLCAAILQHLHVIGAIGGLEIVRTRDPEKLMQCNVVCDVGKEDIDTYTRLCVDHHPKDHNEILETYPNGVKMAACGKLFRALNQIEGLFDLNEIGYEYLLNHLLYPVEAQDNGQSDVITGHNLLNWVDDFNLAYGESPQLQDIRFKEAVSIAREILKRSLIRAEGAIKIMEVMAHNIDMYSGNGILVLSESLPWTKEVTEYNVNHPDTMIKAVIYKSLTDGYNAQMVPVELGSKITICQFPSEWCGHKDKELTQISGIAGGIFCYAGYLSGWDTLEAAIEAARKAIG